MYKYLNWQKKYKEIFVKSEKKLKYYKQLQEKSNFSLHKIKNKNCDY